VSRESMVSKSLTQRCRNVNQVKHAFIKKIIVSRPPPSWTLLKFTFVTWEKGKFF